MANEMFLKYGCNPNQKPSRIYMESGELPITVLNGKPGYINLLDAFNGWQLVRELKQATGMCAATSFGCQCIATLQQVAHSFLFCSFSGSGFLVIVSLQYLEIIVY